MSETSRWKKILPELLAVILCLGVLCVGVSFKEGYHMDELLSFELADARYNPWIVPTQPEGRLAKFVREEIQGDSFGETLMNLKSTVTDVLKNRGSSKLLSYKADVYEEPAWITSGQFQDYVTVDGSDAFDYLSVYFNVKDDNHPPGAFYAVAYYEFSVPWDFVTVAWMYDQSDLCGDHIMAAASVGKETFGDFWYGRAGKTFGDPCSITVRTQYGSTGFCSADPHVLPLILSVCGTAFHACGEMEGT